MIPSVNLSFGTIRQVVLAVAFLFLAGCSSPEDKAQRYYERGMELLSKQDYVKAGIEFKNAIQNKKDLIGAWRGLLAVETHNQNVQGEVAILRTIVELDPKDLDSKLKLGHLLLVGGEADRALELADAAIALDGRNPNPLALKSAALLKLKDATGANREAQAALSIDPANAEAVIVLAIERLLRGDTDGAVAIVQRLAGFSCQTT
jgi:tetratricopeptide (TPR) repeat protein